jgi:nucleoside-diphosphate-sugar epimerase
MGQWPVPVRDTALGHEFALKNDAAGGQRIIVTRGVSHVISDLVSCNSYY